MKQKNYNSDITAGALLLTETKIVVGYLLDDLSIPEISKLVESQNILQKRSVASAKRMYFLIKNRLENFDDELLKMIYYGDSEISRLSALIIAIRNSRVLGDFMLQVIKNKYLLFEKNIDKSSWQKFIREAQLSNPNMPDWSETTIKKIGDCIFRVLAETGYIESSKSGTLQKVYIPQEVRQYLINKNENYTLNCLEVSL